MTERAEQRICINFCNKLEHSSTETIWLIQKAFRDDAMSESQIKANASEMVENLLKLVHILEGLQQAEHLRMLNMYGLQSTKIGDWQCEN